MSFSNYLFLLFLLVPFCNCTDRLGEFCNEDKPLKGRQTSTNIDHVIMSLLAQAPSTGFATASSGTWSEKIYGLVQCREDVSPEDCKSCTEDAAKQIRQVCSKEADARIWFDYCFLRYDTDNFIGELDTGFGIFYWNVENATDPEAFDVKLGGLMDRVRAQAVGPGNEGLGKGETKFTPLITIYGLVQCTRDLSQLLCAQCLAIAVSKFPKFCEHKIGCRVLYSSCYVRYEIYPFFFPLPSEQRNRTSGAFFKAIVYP